MEAYEIILTFEIIFCNLSIIRSLSLLYIAYSYDYFYNFDFCRDKYEKCSIIFTLAYSISPFVIGVLFSFIFKMIFKLNWFVYILSLFNGLFFFNLLDSKFRTLFILFENSKVNLLVHCLFFFILEVIVITFFI